MKDKLQTFKVSKEFKKRMKEAADYDNLTVSSYIVMLVNKDLKEKDIIQETLKRR